MYAKTVHTVYSPLSTPLTLPRQFRVLCYLFQLIPRPPAPSRTFMEDVPLDASLVQRFKDKAMAIVGYEVDQVYRTAEGDRSVPLGNSYNHHYGMDANACFACMFLLIILSLECFLSFRCSSIIYRRWT